VQTLLDLSVIVAEAKDNPAVDWTLRAIERSCAGLAYEVLVVRPAGRGPLPASESTPTRELLSHEDALVPERWGQGVRAARAPVFACLTTELEVDPEWASALLEALGPRTVAAAGAIGLAPGAGAVARAVHLVRFSAFLPAAAPAAGNIPGDGAAYRRDAVIAHADLLSEGFWEAEFHRRFQRAGAHMIFVPRSLVAFRSSVRLRSAAGLRARHGYGYGMTRVMRHGETAARVLLAAPVVPVVMTGRILRRASRSPGMLWSALRALPVLVVICAAWAWGEAAGAWAARRRR
jgi:hypothetical protein